MIQTILKKIPKAFEGGIIERQEKCKVCGNSQAIQIGNVDYWDIKNSNLVKCTSCNHIQLDPMLNDEETSKGCFAYYIEESLRTSKEEQFKNCVRNFRRGVVFANNLKRRKITFKTMLELGPGSGYFSAGVQFVFPHVDITVMDVNTEVLKFNSEQHNYKIVQEIPDNFISSLTNNFDLIIARDIIEHVTDISSVLKNVFNYLKPNGYFHFITPNGHEDVWKHYVTSKLANSPSELLINHVNYFDGKGLKELLTTFGFKAVDYYTYKLKYTFKGRGWKIDKKVMNSLSTKMKADFFVNEKVKELPKIDFNKDEILRKWYIQPKSKWITQLFSWYQHHTFLKINPKLNVGHEIHGLFQKKN